VDIAVDLRAIILVGGAPDDIPASEQFAGLPLALCDVLGKSVLHRAVESLQQQGIGSISIISESAAPVLNTAGRELRSTCSWTETVPAQLWRTAENTFGDLAQSGAEIVLVVRLGAYAEFDLEDLLQQHLASPHHVTCVVDEAGDPLDIALINASRRNEAAYLLRHRLRQARSCGGKYVFRGYHCRLRHVGELRGLALEGLLQRNRLRPDGEEVRPGIWIASHARITRGARIVAPAFIGERVKICASAVITRGSCLEHHTIVEPGTVIENSTLLPFTRVGSSLDFTHTVVSGSRVASLVRKVELDVPDPTLASSLVQHAPLRALTSALSLATFLPMGFLRGLFQRNRPPRPSELPAAAVVHSAALNPPALRAPVEGASSFSANMVVARRYGNQ